MVNLKIVINTSNIPMYKQRLVAWKCWWTHFICRKKLCTKK